MRKFERAKRREKELGSLNFSSLFMLCQSSVYLLLIADAVQWLASAINNHESHSGFKFDLNDHAVF